MHNIVHLSTGSGNVTLIGGTLGGPGIITGAVIAGAAPHTIAPSAGFAGSDALHLNSLTTNLYTTLAFNLQTPGHSSLNDAITVATANALTLSGSTLQINSASTGPASLGYYKAIQYSGAIQGAGISSIVLPPITNNISYTLDTQHDPGFVDIHRGFLGDANDDGTVNGIDLGILAAHFNGVIGAGSFDAALNNFPTLQAASELSQPSSVPEPASLPLLALAATLLAKHKKPT